MKLTTLVLFVGLLALVPRGQFIYHVPQGCTFPSCFPNASNTGVPAGTSLTSYSGANPVTTNGTTIDSKIITSCPLVIEAINVTIKNSQFSCTNSDALYSDDQGNYIRTSNGTTFAVTIQDSDINCGATSTGNTTGLAEAYIHAIRVHIQRCENGGSLQQKSTIEDSFIHNLASVGGDPHEDGFQMPAGHWTGAAYTCTPYCTVNMIYQHNTVYGRTYPNDGGDGTSAFISNHDGDLDSVVITQNLVGGGGTTIYCNRPDAGPMTITSNHFTTTWHATVGSIEADEDCADEATVSGNVYHETGLPITLPPLPLAQRLDRPWLFR